MSGDMPLWILFTSSVMSGATLVTVLLIFAKIMRWSGVVDTKLEAHGNWQRNHMKEQHSP